MATYKHEHTHIKTPDPNKAIEFYVRMMGAKILSEEQRHSGRAADLELGGITLRITGAEKELEGLAHIGLEVDNMNEIIAKMKADGVEIVKEPFEPGPGVRAANIKCPDGVIYELIEKSRD